MRRTAPVVCLVGFSITATAQPARPRARDLGVPFGGTAGPLNAITDVAGVEVGLVTLIDHIKAGRSQTPLNGGHVGPM